MKNLLILLFALHTLQFGYAQCPGCIIYLPQGLQEDTIFITDAPDGTVFEYYEEDLSFRLPMTTTPVASIDSTTPPGLPISQMTITNVSNLPPGLNWEASQLSFNTGEMETDGCVRLCGTPLVPDSFAIQVEVEAVVLGFPNASSFSVPIYIAPAMTGNEGFTMTGNIGCGSATVSFQNENPSNGQSGYTYQWDFGNGNTSTEENPPPQTYSSPGTYTVQYLATIDTAGYFLTQVKVTETDCNDFNIPPADKPDLYIKVFDPQGNQIYTSNVQQNVELPAYFPLYLPIHTGNYSIEVWDDELIGMEQCGSVNFNQTTTGSLSDGPLTVEITIYHPVTSIAAEGQVIVYEQPDPPVLSWFGGPAFCQGDSFIVGTNYDHNLQWYRDSMLLPGDTLPELTIYESGNYRVSYTSPDGCISTSDTVEVVVFPLPEEPVFVYANNWLSLSANIPPDAVLQWFYNDQALEGENGDSLCITQSGSYGLQVTDPATGCSNFYSSEETYNPDMPCSVATLEVDEWYDFRLSPNPFAERLYLHWYSSKSDSWNWQLLSVTGRQMLQGQWNFPAGTSERQMETAHLPKGIYLLQIATPKGLIVKKLMKTE